MTADAIATTGAATVRANPTPAQTWNRLGINDYAVELPALAGEPGAGPAPDVAPIEMGAGDEAMAWLDAAAGDRLRIDVPAGASQALQVDVGSDDVAATDVVVGEGASARIVLVARAERGTSGSALRVDAGRDARVELVAVAANGPEASLLDAVGIRLAEGARADVRQYVLGGGTVAMSVVVDEVGRGSRYEQSTRYLVHGGESLDMSYVARMRGEGTRADLAFNGILEDGARKRLSDVIDLVHGARGARGHEDETVLVAGGHVENLALPSVLCGEDDVEGTHGATIGSVSPEQLGYLTNHGLDEAESQALFVRALFDDALQQVPEAAEAVLAAAGRTLGAEAAAEIRESAGVA